MQNLLIGILCRVLSAVTFSLRTPSIYTTNAVAVNKLIAGLACYSSKSKNAVCTQNVFAVFTQHDPSILPAHITF
jgi:hypothetical protein